MLWLSDRHNPGNKLKVTVWVTALLYSDYFCVEGITCCDNSKWLRVNNNALNYFSGVTQTVTPDNCKVAVTENKDMDQFFVKQDFQVWMEHNGTVIQPVKVRIPTGSRMWEGIS